MSNVVYLSVKYPNKKWMIDFLALEAARLMQDGQKEKGIDLMKGLPSQLLEAQFFQEVERQGEFLELEA